MTQIVFSTRFKRMYRKLPVKHQRFCDERIRLFAKDSRHPLLNIHSLGGEYAGCFSINITGDIRAVWCIIGVDAAHFIAVGTHSELYGS